ncbi:MgtC/SapB family protein [Shinella sp. S4-D37]|uniref:MgtC/SapB family protein n=1 Tax=Shinella sp. S4-D37 TaxID=3161999 RepID=UPI0034660C39
METTLARLGLALAIGLLVGLERGWRERGAPARSRTAGIRTYGISGLLGGIFSALSQSMEAASLMVAGFLGFAVVFAFYKAREAAHDEDFSVTSVVAGLCVFALGALAAAGETQAAAGGGAALAAILASREVLHELLKRLTWEEVRSALILAVMTAIILPVLPSRTIDPWGGLNPHEVWFFTVLTAAISYLGYIAVRLLGATRGLIVSAVSGALVSSTAVTLALGRNASSGAAPYPLAGAATFAAIVSIGRVCVVIGLIKPQVLLVIGPAAFSAMLVFGLCGALLLMRGHGSGGVASTIRSPFELGPLLLFALLFAIAATANAALVRYSGSQGIVAAAAVSGAVDVDVAVLGALRLVGSAATAEIVGQAVLAAMTSNALFRVVLAVASGPMRFWVPLLLATVMSVAAGGIVFSIFPPL